MQIHPAIGAARDRSLRKYLLLTGVVLGLAGGSGAAEPRLDIRRLDSVPVIDGVLDDPAWKSAAHIVEFRQVVPVEGAEPSERTEVYLGYDANTVYVAFICHHTQPEDIVAKRLRDDEFLGSDDSIYIAFDTFRDRRNSFMFAINPLGTKRDARLEDNRNTRQEWDGIWYADARRTDQGWTAEMAIPVKTLSFTSGVREWGMNVSRMIRHNNEWVQWANISQDKAFEDASAFGELIGLEGLDQGMGLDLRPSVAARFTDDQDAGDQDLKLRPGGEAVYKITPSFNGSLIVNPDFSDARVDDVQTNLTRFSLFFPEQRDFFVRDADIFQFGGLVASANVGLPGANALPFFSRRIGLLGDIENPEIIDLDAGVKLSGRLGRYTLGLLNTQMDSLHDLDAKNLTVARAAVDVLEESRVGAIFTYGDPFSDNDNAVAGTDFRYRDSDVFDGKVFEADAYVMGSSTSGVRGDEFAFGVNLKYPNDIWNGRLGFNEIQENFNPAIGFVSRSGVRKYDGEVRYRFRSTGGGWFRTLDWGFTWELFTDRTNDLESLWLSPSLLTVETSAGDTIDFWYDYKEEELTQPFEIQPGIVIPIGRYRWHDLYGRVETAQDRPVSAQFEWVIGEFYDGHQTDLRGRIHWRPAPQLLLGVEHRIINANLPYGHFDIEINRAWFDVLINPRIAWTNYLQQESESHFMTLNSQLRWILVPGNELWITLNHDWMREDGAYRSRDADLTAKFFWTKRY